MSERWSFFGGAAGGAGEELPYFAAAALDGELGEKDAIKMANTRHAHAAGAAAMGIFCLVLVGLLKQIYIDFNSVLGEICYIFMNMISIIVIEVISLNLVKCQILVFLST